MSMELMASSERVCYVHCNLCNTILAVSVPAFNSLLTTTATATATVVTVRCGHCANLLSVNIGAASLQYYSLPSPNPSPTTGTAHPHAQHYHSHPNLHTLQKHHQVSSEDSSSNKDYGSSSSSSTSSKFTAAASAFNQASTTTTVDQPRISPIRPPEKRQRVPSAYNRFIKRKSKGLKLVILTLAIGKLLAQQPKIGHIFLTFTLG